MYVFEWFTGTTVDRWTMASPIDIPPHDASPDIFSDFPEGIFDVSNDFVADFLKRVHGSSTFRCLTCHKGLEVLRSKRCTAASTIRRGPEPLIPHAVPTQ